MPSERETGRRSTAHGGNGDRSIHGVIPAVRCGHPSLQQILAETKLKNNCKIHVHILAFLHYEFSSRFSNFYHTSYVFQQVSTDQQISTDIYSKVPKRIKGPYISLTCAKFDIFFLGPGVEDMIG